MVDFPVARNLDNARAIGPLGRFRAARSVLAGVLATAITDAVTQRRNFILWPFAMIVGLIIYRILPMEPALLTL
jgi:competence protein ComEC